MNKKYFLISIALLSIILTVIALKGGNTSLLQKIHLRERYLQCIEDNKPARVKGECLRDLAMVTIKYYRVDEIETELLSIAEFAGRQWCHEFMHYAGWELYRKTKSLYESFITASDKCDSGMYHGVAEEYINETSQNYNPETFVKAVIPKACSEDTDRQNVPAAMKVHCYHGLGHAFMFIADNDLNQSLTYCDHVTSSFIESCYTGAFMENIQSKQVGRTVSHTSKFSYNLSKPDYPCNTLDEKYKERCYIYKGVSNVLFTQVDIKQSMIECLKVNPAYQEKCFWGVGNNIPGPHISSRGAGEKCEGALAVGSRAYEQCILGGMAFLIQLNLGNAQAAIEYCAVIKPEFKYLCYRAAGKNMNGWVTQNETLQQKCRQFPDSTAQKLCENSN